MTDHPITEEDRRALEAWLAEKLEPKETLSDPLAWCDIYSEHEFWANKALQWKPRQISESVGLARAVVDAMVRRGFLYQEWTDIDDENKEIHYEIIFGYLLYSENNVTNSSVDDTDYPLAVCLAAKAALESEAQ